MPDEDAVAAGDAPGLPWIREPYDPDGNYPEPPPVPSPRPTRHARSVTLAMVPIAVLALWLALAPFQAQASTFNCGSPVLQPIGTMNLTEREGDKLINDCPESAGIGLQQAFVLAVLSILAIGTAALVDRSNRPRP
ncbi:MAG TPA: hypothetical protein VMY34_05760 [Acidimicrobiales bacterium]|nr:hypothetical protein [Acidimicrobiales bacterium]